jgi:hypothetical protein
MTATVGGRCTVTFQVTFAADGIQMLKVMRVDALLWLMQEQQRLQQM